MRNATAPVTERPGVTLPKRRDVLVRGAALAGALCAPPLIARAGTPVTFGFSAVSDYMTVFVAANEGMFAARGIDIDMKLIPLNPIIISAIEAGSLQIGGPAVPPFLQAVDGGLDHVVVAGGGTTSKRFTDAGLVVRTGSGIHTAADCVGKKIGVPGIGGMMQVMFRYWLSESKVDPGKVTFVEAPFPQHADLLRTGAVDGVTSVGTFLTRITDSGQGYVASFFTTFMPEGRPSIVHTAKRDWVRANPKTAKDFRDALIEAARFIAKPENNGKTREAALKYLKVPPEVAAKMQISPPLPVVTANDLQFWGDMMHKQKMLKTQLDYPRLIAA